MLAPGGGADPPPLLPAVRSRGPAAGRSTARTEGDTMSFDSFEIDPTLLAGVRDLGFTRPTDIQQDAIPWGLEGRDVMACAMTGSGKTAAFALPILERLLHRERGTTRALILSPTRELALQIEEHVRELAAHTGITAATIYGGVAYEAQERAFREGVDVLVATPGRLLDHLRRPYARLDDLEVLVLDEADRMLDMGFIPDVRRILAQVPAERQTMFFSATLPPPVVKLANDMLADPVTINLERRAIPAEGVRQVVYPVRHELKPALLLHLLERHDMSSALVFTRTRDRADLTGGYLRRAGIEVAVIHGERGQAERSRTMEAFKKGKYRVLVATDVAARGIDVEELSHVVNLDVPNQPDDYIHRVGRTARAGATGDAITFVAARELADLHLIEKSIGQKLERVRLEDFDYSRSAAAAVAERAGAAAETVEPAEPEGALEPVAEAQRSGAELADEPAAGADVEEELAAGRPADAEPAVATAAATAETSRLDEAGEEAREAPDAARVEPEAPDEPPEPEARDEPPEPPAVAARGRARRGRPQPRPERGDAAERFARLRARRTGDRITKDVDALPSLPVPEAVPGEGPEPAPKAAEAAPRRGSPARGRRRDRPDRPGKDREVAPPPNADALERFARLRARRGR